VINTHLHFDHAGGNTMDNGSGTLVPAFPKARYVVQRGEYETPCEPMNGLERVIGGTTFCRSQS
jgi:Zn-dependent hydrolases, including glyoxylases